MDWFTTNDIPIEAIEVPEIRWSTKDEKERKKSLTRGHVIDIGSAGGIQSYGGRGTKGLWPGSAFVPSR